MNCMSKPREYIAVMMETDEISLEVLNVLVVVALQYDKSVMRKCMSCLTAYKCFLN